MSGNELSCQEFVEIVTEYLEGGLSDGRPRAVRGAPRGLRGVCQLPRPDPHDDLPESSHHSRRHLRRDEVSASRVVPGLESRLTAGAGCSRACGPTRSGGPMPARSSGEPRRRRTFPTGRPASRQSRNPPMTSPTRRYPSSFSTAAARTDEQPWSQSRMTCGVEIGRHTDCGTRYREPFAIRAPCAECGANRARCRRGRGCRPNGCRSGGRRSPSPRTLRRREREIRASASARSSASVRRSTPAFIDPMMCDLPRGIKWIARWRTPATGSPPPRPRSRR